LYFEGKKLNYLLLGAVVVEKERGKESGTV
jgi:hypothetical protein